jgi:hypothetical protein
VIQAFAYGFGGGFADFVVQPYKGSKEDGMAGFAKGVGKGTVSGLSKTSSGTSEYSTKYSSLFFNTLPALIGLIAYPGQGIYKSLRAATHGATARSIVDSQRAESSYLAHLHKGPTPEVRAVLSGF